MKPLDKVKRLKELAEENIKSGYKSPYNLDINPEENKWQPGEIESLQKAYAWLPPLYWEFIREYDTLGLAGVVFHGSKNSAILTIYDEIEYWKTQAQAHYFPFANDVDGSIYNFNRKGEVILFWSKDPDWEDPIFIAHTFEEFIGECLLGSRCTDKVMGRDTEEGDFYAFLKSEGWV